MEELPQENEISITISLLFSRWADRFTSLQRQKRIFVGFKTVSFYHLKNINLNSSCAAEIYLVCSEQSWPTLAKTVLASISLNFDQVLDLTIFVSFSNYSHYMLILGGRGGRREMTALHGSNSETKSYMAS